MNANYNWALTDLRSLHEKQVTAICSKYDTKLKNSLDKYVLDRIDDHTDTAVSDMISRSMNTIIENCFNNFDFVTEVDSVILACGAQQIIHHVKSAIAQFDFEPHVLKRVATNWIFLALP